MKYMKVATVLILALTLALPVLPAMADVDIVITTGGDVDLNLITGNGTLLSIDYDGRDLLAEIEAHIQTIESFRTMIAYLSARNDVAELQDDIDALDANLEKLVGELNAVLNDLYHQVGFQAHIIGVNPGNNSVAKALIAGNVTVADYIEGILGILDGVSQKFYATEVQLEDIRDKIMLQDTVLSEAEFDIEVLESSIQLVEEYIDYLNNDVLTVLQSVDTELQDEVTAQGIDIGELQEELDTQDMSIEELRDALDQVFSELMTERANRNNLTIMYVAFSVLCIIIVAYKQVK